MAQIQFPKLPCAKLGIVKNKSGTYYYVQTYTHHYDKNKKRSVRDSQKTIGKVLGGDKFGVIEFKQFFLDEHPELENFITYWTKDGFDFKVIDDEAISAVYDNPLEKKLAGASWALQKLMGQNGIGDALKETFGSYKRYLKLASIIIYMVLKRSNALHYFETFSKTTFLPWPRPLNDSQITRLFKSVSHDELMQFFNALNRAYCRKFGEAFYNNVFVALDSTSISTYSNNLTQKEFGHNKDGDALPQINYLLVCDEVYGLPIYAKTYKGNVVDVCIVKNLLSELKIMLSHHNNEPLLPNITFVTDRGYDSEDNLQLFLNHGYNFVMRSTLRSSWVKDVVRENYDNLMDDNSLDVFTSQQMHTAIVEYKYDDFPVEHKLKSNKACQNIYVHMFFDEKIKNTNRSVIKENTANARDRFNLEVDKLYKDNDIVNPAMLSKIDIGKQQMFIDRYCKFDDKGYALISSELINERVKYDGIMVLLSNSVDNPQKAYFAYQKRRTVESNFQIFKDHLNFNRVYTSSDRTFVGKFLCQMLSASLMMILNMRIRNYEKSEKAQEDKIKLSSRSLSKLLDELNTIMLTVYKGGYYFDVISEKYKTLLNAIGVDVPEVKHRYEQESYDNDLDIDDSSDDYYQSDDLDFCDEREEI